MAQLALNTLKTPVVIPEDNTLHITGGSGDTNINITGGSVNYVVTASSQPYASAIIDDLFADGDTLNGVQGCIIELGEKLYDGKLQLNDSVGVYDDFGRPARKWQYDGVNFGTYAKKEQLRKQYTVKVTGKELYDLLGNDIISGINGTNRANPWGLSVTIDGETDYSVLNPTGAFFSEISLTRTNTDKVGDTGNGVLTQVYVDSIHHQVDIAVINTYLAQAQQDYNAKDDDVDLKVWSISQKNHTGRFVKSDKDDNDPTVIVNLEEKMTAQGDKVEIKEIKKDDLVLVTVADGEIQSVTKPEIVSETTLNSFKRGDWVKNDDAQYDYATTAYYDDEVLDEYSQTNMKDVTYNVILDPYGYLIGIELNEAANQYAFLTGMDLGNSNLSVKNASANLIFLDGTMKTVTVNVEKSEYAKKVDGKNITITGKGEDLGDVNKFVPTFSNTSDRSMSQVNTWCTYTVDGDGVYTLKQVGSYSTARKGTPGGGDPIKDAKKIAQSAINVSALDDRSTDTNSDGEVVINNKNTFLMGSAHNDVKDIAYYGAGTATVDGDFQYVYGNNETVYINASLKKATSKDYGERFIVNKIDSVVTGISNVDMNVKDLTSATNLTGANATNLPTNEIYTLYNDKGYAIAVVALNATDNGTSSRYVYITDSVSQEDYNGNSEWKWYREAIMDGKKVLLTEADDGWDYLANDKMETGKWYSVTFNKDGHVNGVKYETGTTNRYIDFDYAPYDAGWTTGSPDYSQAGDRYPDKFITTVAQINLATEGKDDFNKSHDSVLLYADFRCDLNGHTNTQDDHHVNGYPHAETNVEHPAWLEVKGDTVFTDRAESAGFRINANTKIVLITSKSHNGGKFDQVIDGYEGTEGMDQALDDLDAETVDSKTRFDGVLTAIFDRGVATVVILNDESGNGKNKVPENDGSMNVTFKFMEGATQRGTITKNIKVDTTFVPSTLLTESGLSGYKVTDNSSIKVEFQRRQNITVEIPVEAVVEETMVVEVNWKNGVTDNKVVYELKVPAGKTMSFVPGTTKDKDGNVIDVPAGTILDSKTSETIFVTTDSLIKVEFPVKTAIVVKMQQTKEDGTVEIVDKSVAADSTIKSLYEAQYGAGSAKAGIFVAYTPKNGTETGKASTDTATTLNTGDTVKLLDRYVKLGTPVATVNPATAAGMAAGTATVSVKAADSTAKVTIDSQDYLKIGGELVLTITVQDTGAVASTTAALKASAALTNGATFTLKEGTSDVVLAAGSALTASTPSAAVDVTFVVGLDTTMTDTDGNIAVTVSPAT